MNARHDASAVLEMARTVWPQRGTPHTKKRVLCPLYVSGVIALLLGGGALAAPTATLTAGTTNPSVGQTFTVTVNLAGAPGFACWGAAPRYDGAKLALVSQATGSYSTFVPDSRELSAIDASGQARTGGYGTSDNAGGSGTLAVLTFRALAAGTTAISLDAYSAGNLFGVALYSTNGTTTLPAVGGALSIVIGGGTDPNADSDGDGIPDWWMTKYFGHPTAQAADLSRADDDPDGDGMSNWKEWRCDTRPKDSTSFLGLTALAANGSVPGEFLVRWQSVSNKTYTLQVATNLLVGFVNLRTNITATPMINLHTDSAGGAKQRFYRVVVE